MKAAIDLVRNSGLGSIARTCHQLAARVRELERQQQSPPVYLQRIEELAIVNSRSW